MFERVPELDVIPPPTLSISSTTNTGFGHPVCAINLSGSPIWRLDHPASTPCDSKSGRSGCRVDLHMRRASFFCDDLCELTLSGSGGAVKQDRRGKTGRPRR